MNDDDIKLNVLRASRLASDLSSAECTVLAAVCTHRQLADGEVLVHEGKADSRLHVVASGELAVVRGIETHERVPIAMIHPGELAGELGFVDGSVRHASLVAVGPTVVLTLERDRLESLLDAHGVVVYHVMRAIVRSVHEIQRRLSLQAVELTNYIYKQHGRY